MEFRLKGSPRVERVMTGELILRVASLAFLVGVFVFAFLINL